MESPWRKYRRQRDERPRVGTAGSHDFYKALFRSAPSPYLILKCDSPRFTILEVNDAYLAATNTTRQALLGRGLFTVFPDNPEDEGATGERNLRESLERVLATSSSHVMSVQKYDIPRPSAEGGGFEERYWSPLNTPVLSPRGNVTRIIHYVEDVTEVALLARLRDSEGERVAALRTRNEWLESEIHQRTAAEARLDAALESERVARADAERANIYKSAFIAKMSHELRTPLNAIGGYVQLLEMGVRGEVTAGQSDFLTRIKTSEEHLLRLINEVLDLARIESGRMDYEIADVNVQKTFLEVEGFVAPQILAKQIECRFDTCDPSLSIRADGEKVRQILINILSNAVKNTEPGGKISVWCDANSENCQLKVEDTGRGIPEDQLERIFEPFVQVEGTAAAGGVGLGLPISRELAHGMGGSLHARSKAGAGATFILQLPRGAGGSCSRDDDA